jgi:uncharacterized protein
MKIGLNHLADGLRAIWAAFWRIVLFLILFAVFGALFFVPFGPTLKTISESAPSWGQLLADAVGAVVMLIATWVMVRFVDHRPLRTIGLERGNLLPDFASGVGLGLSWLAASIGAVWAVGWAVPQTPTSASGAALLLAGAAVLLNVFTQQLLLCGYILQTLRHRFGFGVAVIVSAALFMAFHAGAFKGAVLPAVNVFLAGVLFCLAYQITNNLWLPTATHFAWNFSLGSLLGLTVSGSDALRTGHQVFIIDGPPLFTGGAFGLEGGFVVSITTALAILAVGAIGKMSRLKVSARRSEHAAAGTLIGRNSSRPK